VNQTDLNSQVYQNNLYVIDRPSIFRMQHKQVHFNLHGSLPRTVVQLHSGKGVVQHPHTLLSSRRNKRPEILRRYLHKTVQRQHNMSTS
jgi:hypothetical protein